VQLSSNLYPLNGNHLRQQWIYNLIVFDIPPIFLQNLKIIPHLALTLNSSD